MSSAKVTAQNAEKERVKADFEARIAEEANALRDATKKKLQKAATKREGERLSWLSRLQQSSLLGKDKASLLYEESEQKSKELEVSLKQKITAAEFRREENIKKKFLEESINLVMKNFKIIYMRGMHAKTEYCLLR